MSVSINIFTPPNMLSSVNHNFYYTFIFIFFVSFTSFSHSANNTLIVGYSHYPPFQWTDEDGNPQGVDIDIISAVLDDSGFSAQFKKMPWTRQLQVGIKNGELDILMQAKRTYAREKIAYFSDKMYLNVNNAFFIRKADSAKFESIKNLHDLIGSNLTVGIIRGSVYSEEHQRLQNNPLFNARLVDLSIDDQSINMLLSGRIDAFMATDLSISHLLRNSPRKHEITLHIHLNTHDTLNRGSLFMFSKKSMSIEQVSKINVSLTKLLSNGAIARILSHHGFAKL